MFNIILDTSILTYGESTMARLTILVENEALKEFKGKCKLMNRTHQNLIRELISAINEDRLKITPAAGQQDLYT